MQRAGGRSPALRAGALVPTLSTFPPEGFAEDKEGSSAAASPLALSPRAVAPRRVDYEYGKAYDKQDAAKYFGGMQGEKSSFLCFLLSMRPMQQA